MNKILLNGFVDEVIKLSAKKKRSGLWWKVPAAVAGVAGAGYLGRRALRGSAKRSIQKAEHVKETASALKDLGKSYQKSREAASDMPRIFRRIDKLKKANSSMMDVLNRQLESF